MTQTAPQPSPTAANTTPSADAPRVTHNARPFRLVTRADEIFEVNRDWPKITEDASPVDASIAAILDFPDEFEVDEKGDPIVGGRLLEEAYFEIVGLPRMIVRCQNNDARALRVRLSPQPYAGPELVPIFHGIYLDPTERKLYADRRTFAGKDGPDFKDQLFTPQDPEAEGLKVFVDRKRDLGIRIGDLMARQKGVVGWIPAKEVRMVEYQWDVAELQEYLNLEIAARYTEPVEIETDVQAPQAPATANGAVASSPATPPSASLFEAPR